MKMTMMVAVVVIKSFVLVFDRWMIQALYHPNLAAKLELGGDGLFLNCSTCLLQYHNVDYSMCVCVGKSINFRLWPNNPLKPPFFKEFD